jgi:DNA-binding transcriptional MerR regulator
MTDDRKDQKTLSELAEESGIPGRTIRFYVSRSLLPGPHQAGRGAYYGHEHLDQLKKIKDLQAAGKTLAEISYALGNTEEKGVMVKPTGWWNYQISDDVVVMVRADSSPWRLRHIQKSISHLANQLAIEHSEEE